MILILLPVAALPDGQHCKKYDIYRTSIKNWQSGTGHSWHGQGTQIIQRQVSPRICLFQASHRSIFVKMADTWIHFFIMTNEKNHHDTTFFKEHDYFSYNPEYVHFFKQKWFLQWTSTADISRIAMSPNLGWFSSSAKGRPPRQTHEIRNQVLNIFSVDNVLQRIADFPFSQLPLSGGKVVCRTRRLALTTQESHISSRVL